MGTEEAGRLAKITGADSETARAVQEKFLIKVEQKLDISLEAPTAKAVTLLASRARGCEAALIAGARAMAGQAPGEKPGMAAMIAMRRFAVTVRTINNFQDTMTGPIEKCVQESSAMHLE